MATPGAPAAPGQAQAHRAGAGLRGIAGRGGVLARAGRQDDENGGPAGDDSIASALATITITSSLAPERGRNAAAP